MAWAKVLARRAQSRGTLTLAGLFTACAFAMGGSSRADVASLEVLRPLAVAVLGVALLSVRREHVSSYRAPLAIAILCAALLAAQLVPLPGGLGGALPGRGLVAEIDALTGLDAAWRPLSLWPPATQNSLWALLVPLSLLVTCIQLPAADLARLLTVVLLAGAASAILALLQTIGDPQGALYFYDVTNFGSAVGLFANRNHQAALLACLIPLAFAAAQLRRSNWRVWGGAGRNADPGLVVAIAATAFLVPLILVTGSRSGLLLGAVALASLAGVLPAGIRLPGREGFWGSRRVRLALGAGAIGALVSVTVYLQRDLAIDRIIDPAAGGDMRTRILPAARDMLELYLPWGTGAGTFREVYGANEPAALLAGFYMNQAHNDWLDVALASGLPGLAIAGAAIAAWIARAVTVFSGGGSDEFQPLRKAGLAVLLILALASLSDYPLRTPALACIFALAAVWAALPRASVSDRGAQSPPHKIFDVQGN